MTASVVRSTISLVVISFNDATLKIVRTEVRVAGAGSDREKRGDLEKDPEGELPLTPVTLNILLALADEERHGYGIMLEVGDRTGGKMRLGPGTLYSSIKRLVEGGLIEESGERPAPESDDERRRYYRLTGFGARVLAAEVGRLEATVRAARKKGAYPGAGAPGTAMGAAG